MNRQRDDRIALFRKMISRRQALGYMAAASSVVLSGHGVSDVSASCSEIKSETAGPFAADGSGRADVLADPAIFRSDIRTNLDGGNLQPGIDLAVVVTVLDVSNDCVPLSGASVYLWHCNAEGQYSAYSGFGQGDHTDHSFLRGVQVTDENGDATFTTIYPGRYYGRATHFHARIYQDDSFGTILKTTQFAFDDALNNTVYASSSTYETSHVAREITNAGDGVFREGVSDQLIQISGDSSAGYAGSIIVGV